MFRDYEFEEVEQEELMNPNYYRIKAN